MSQHRKRNRNLGLVELIAIALGGMVGGGIFAILGVSAAMIGSLTPVAILIGGMIASLAAYSYVKLGLYYKDEGATYSFFKKTYKNSHLSASAIGWFVIFGYISTLALYAYTFASYALSSSDFADSLWMRKGLAICVITVFGLINVWSVNGMGKIEDLMVYTKLVILILISYVLIQHGSTNFAGFIENVKLDASHSSMLSILIVSSITFVAFEGFQLVINAVNEMANPDKSIPRAIYSAIFLALVIYLVIAIGAFFSIPIDQLIKDKEYALASGAAKVLGKTGEYLVILGAILATSSAISGTLFGSSRQLAVIAGDGYFPSVLAKRIRNIPIRAILAMSATASVLIIAGGLELILEFGSITFLLVSLLMAIANFKIRKQTDSSSVLTIIAIVALSVSGILILYYEFTKHMEQMVLIVAIYIMLTIAAVVYAKRRERGGRLGQKKVEDNH